MRNFASTLILLAMVAGIFGGIMFGFGVAERRVMQQMRVTCAPDEGLVYVEYGGNLYAHYYEEVRK